MGVVKLILARSSCLGPCLLFVAFLVVEIRGLEGRSRVYRGLFQTL